MLNFAIEEGNSYPQETLLDDEGFKAYYLAGMAELIMTRSH